MHLLANILGVLAIITVIAVITHLIQTRRSPKAATSAGPRLVERSVYSTFDPKTGQLQDPP